MELISSNSKEDEGHAYAVIRQDRLIEIVSFNALYLCQITQFNYSTYCNSIALESLLGLENISNNDN